MTTELETSAPAGRPAVWSLPNQVTASRLVLTLILFCFFMAGWFGTSFVLFVIAAATDWLDGYCARRYGLVTQLGRILDPFADKLIVCGTLIFLAATPASRIAPWFAVVVMARELLVTALRSFLEQQGRDFSADMSGKLKMVLQCIAAGSSLFYLAWSPDWLTVPLDASVWIAAAATIYSGGLYVRRAVRLAAE